MKITEKQFKIFKEEARYWIKYFGLTGWRIEFTKRKLNEEAAANLHWGIKDRLAVINMEPIADTVCFDEKSIRRSAFHEVCELLFVKLGDMAEGKISNHDNAVTEEIHGIIRTLENTIFNERTRRDDKQR